MLSTSNRQLYRFLFAASLGTFLEFFDLALYSFCSALIAQNFFPQNTDSSFALVFTWLIFGISYLMRPLGAICFGHLADVKSGKGAMLISMVLMALATCGIGVLPTYSKIGMFAPLILLLCRIVQSIAVSPEYNLASVFIKNNAWCQNHFGFVSSISAAVTGVGMLSASWLMGLIFGSTSILEIPEYKWRLPFILAGILVGTVGIYFRANIDENILPKKSPVLPLSLVLKKQGADFLKASFIAGYIGCITYALFSFLIYQLQQVRHMSPGDALAILGFGTFIPATFSLIAGYWSDYVPRYLLMLGASLVIIISGYQLFSHIDILSEQAIVIQSCLMLAGLGFFAGGFPGYLAEIFAQQYRYTGSFLAYNIGMSWIGGFCPILFIGLQKIHNSLPIALIVGYSLLVMVLLIRPIFALNARQSDII